RGDRGPAGGPGLLRRRAREVGPRRAGPRFALLEGGAFRLGADRRPSGTRGAVACRPRGGRGTRGGGAEGGGPGPAAGGPRIGERSRAEGAGLGALGGERARIPGRAGDGGSR